MLVLMYVYFDKKGDIKAITPGPSNFPSEFKSANFPLPEVEDFLTGKKNPFDYLIKKIKSPSGFVYRIEKKVSGIVYTRTLDNYLTRVEEKIDNDTLIIITNNTILKTITIKLTPNFNNFLDIDKQELDEILKSAGNGLLHFTEKNNPYRHLQTVSYCPGNLIYGKISVKYQDNIDLSNSSLYTKKALSKYGYRII